VERRREKMIRLAEL
jgi:hypothetical protein